MPQRQRDFLDPLPVPRHQVEALLNGPEQTGDPRASGHFGALLVDIEGAYVEWLAGSFEVEEGSVERTKASRHQAPSLRRRSRSVLQAFYQRRSQSRHSSRHASQPPRLRLTSALA